MDRRQISHQTALGCVALTIVLGGLSHVARADQPARLYMPESFPDALLSDASEGAADDLQTGAGAAGEVEIVRERYPDGKTKIERQVTLDANGNYVNHGPWKMFTPSGDVVAEGHFNMGQRVGLWTRWHARNDSPVFGESQWKQFKAPFMSQANFSDGVMDGEWIVTDANERKCMQISLKAGQRHGMAVTWLPNGKIAGQATYDQGVPVGDVLEANSRTGELARAASYVDGRKIITNTTYYSGTKQKKTETMYLAATTVEQSPDEFWGFRLAKYASQGEDLRHGASKAWYADGKPQQEGFYDYNKRAGTFTYWYENGQVAATGEYKDDRAEGIWVWWHANGQKSAIGKYQDGALIGDWRWWNDEGKLTKQQVYDGTEPISSQSEATLDLGQVLSDGDTAVR